MNNKNQSTSNKQHVLFNIFDDIKEHGHYYVNGAMMKKANLNYRAARDYFYGLARNSEKDIQITSNNANPEEFWVLCGKVRVVNKITEEMKKKIETVKLLEPGSYIKFNYAKNFDFNTFQDELFQQKIAHIIYKHHHAFTVLRCPDEFLKSIERNAENLNKRKSLYVDQYVVLAKSNNQIEFIVDGPCEESRVRSAIARLAKTLGMKLNTSVVNRENKSLFVSVSRRS